MRSTLIAALFASTAAALPAWASTPYQAAAPDGTCNGKSACKIAFPVVAAGETLTILHISCSLTTTGEQGGVDTILLSTVKAPRPTDFLPPNTIVAGSNFRAGPNLPTFFTVKAGDQALITISGTSAIIGSGAEGCFISGTQTP